MRFKIAYIDGSPTEDLPSWAAGVDIFGSGSGCKPVKRITRVTFGTDGEGGYCLVIAEARDEDKPAQATGHTEPEATRQPCVDLEGSPI